MRMAATPTYEIGLFATTPEGVSMVGRSMDPDLIQAVRAHIAAERRRELAELEGPVRPEAPEPQVS
jgi:hypothetical protein